MENTQEEKNANATSFGYLIREYQKAGYPTRKSIEMAYSKEYQQKNKENDKKYNT